MHHTQKAKYLALKKAGTDPQELEKQMLEANIDPAEVAAFIAESLPADDGKAPAKAEKGDTKAKDKAPASDEAAATSPVYEEWKMSKSFDDKQKVILEKVSKVRDVKIDDARAKRLNEHAENRLVKYFPKQK